MNELVFSSAIGGISGSRSMLGPALIVRNLPLALPRPRQSLRGALASPAVRRLITVLAAGELVADKSARIPSRTDAVPLAGRAVSGAMAAATLARPGHRVRAAVAGAAGAVVAGYALRNLRKTLTARGMPNMLAGLVEDAVAIGAGVLLVRAAAQNATVNAQLPI